MEWCAGVRDEEGVWEGGRAGMGVCARRQRRGVCVCARDAEREGEREAATRWVCVRARESESE